MKCTVNQMKQIMNNFMCSSISVSDDEGVTSLIENWQEAISHGAAERLLVWSPSNTRLIKQWTAVRRLDTCSFQHHGQQQALTKDSEKNLMSEVLPQTETVFFFSVDVMMKPPKIIFYSRIIPDYIIPLGYLITTTQRKDNCSVLFCKLYQFS